MRIKIFVFSCLVFFNVFSYSQDIDSILIRNIFSEALSSNIAYENLRYLCKNTKGRICGSPEAAAAVEFTKQVMEHMDIDSVFLQELMVHNWKRGKKEYARVSSSIFGSEELSICALGESVGTGPDGIYGQLIEVQNFEELAALGEKEISGRIVFFNRPMDPTIIQTFSSYGGAANQRTRGPAEAAKYGAKAVVVRSLTTALDDFPHTGVTRYDIDGKKIPAVAISTLGAEKLSKWLKYDPLLTFYFITECLSYPETKSYNVVGEITGSVFPDEIITVGGHLDAWDNSEGAHDDGAGCVQSIEVLRIFKKLGIRPKRTIRAVMFMDEEVAQRGGLKYAEIAKLNNENHYAALESDRGGLIPKGFGFGASGIRLQKLIELKNYFKPYGINEFVRGGGGVDIGPLRQFNTLLMSIIPDPQRYFDYHHSPNDTFEQVNQRELQLGSAAITALIYLIDKYDL